MTISEGVKKYGIFYPVDGWVFLKVIFKNIYIQGVSK